MNKEIELVNAPPLKIKYLREDQKENLCKFWKRNKCIGCPLTFILYNYRHCYKEIERLNKTIEDFWNKELNEKETNVANDEFIKYCTKEDKENSK